MSKKSKSQKEFIDLTIITMVLKKDVGDNLAKSFLDTQGVQKDDYGRDYDYYKDLGIDPPEDLMEVSNTPGKTIFQVKQEDLETLEAKTKIRPSAIVFFSESDGGLPGSTVYLDLDYKISVKETIKQIEKKIKKVKKNGVK
jgi:hypothetical protein